MGGRSLIIVVVVSVSWVLKPALAFDCWVVSFKTSFPNKGSHHCCPSYQSWQGYNLKADKSFKTSISTTLPSFMSNSQSQRVNPNGHGQHLQMFSKGPVQMMWKRNTWLVNQNKLNKWRSKQLLWVLPGYGLARRHHSWLIAAAVFHPKSIN